MSQVAGCPQTKDKTSEFHLKEAHIIIHLRKLLTKELHRLLKKLI